MQALGIKPDATENIPRRVALFADNSPRWMVSHTRRPLSVNL
ncbi:MAG: hypothetical protein ACHBN1_35140 [Heteroscytonema crispum UTEX LB 1556]